MTQEDKELILKDLCSRLPYNVIINNTDEDDYRVEFKCFLTPDILNDIMSSSPKWTYKPYLRPMSSMTPKEEDEFEELTETLLMNGSSEEIWNTVIDWLNAHHFDHRHLIEKGLALEAEPYMYSHFGDMKVNITVENG